MENSQNAEQKIRVCYVTSPRELQGEGVGHDARIVPTLEYLHNLSKTHPFYANMEIAAVFVDDSGREQNRQSLPQENAAYSYLRNFCAQNGIAFHTEESKGWRSMPLMVEQGNAHVKNAAKHEAKVQYEERMLSFMRENNIDVVFSDSYTVLFNSVMLDEKKGYPGLIVNIHPGIAVEVPGVFPTKDALARANFFTDDAAERKALQEQLAAGAQTLSIRRNGHDSSIHNVLGRMGTGYTMDETHVHVNVAPNIFRQTTGATFHVVDAEVDHGPIIAMSTSTSIRASDTEQELRIRNYGTKNKTVGYGMHAFLHKPETQELITQNRMRNRAFNGEMHQVTRWGVLQSETKHDLRPTIAMPK